MQSEEEIARLALVKNILNILCLLSSHLRIYPQGNEVVRSTLSRLMLQFERYFAEAGALELVVARHGFIWNENFVDRSNHLLQNLAHTIFMHGVAIIRFNNGLSEYEIMTFLRLLGRNVAESWDEGGMRDALEARRIDNIEIRELSEDDFTLREKTEEGQSATEIPDRSDLWDNFAYAIYLRQHGHDSGDIPSSWEPEKFADATSSFLKTAEELLKREIAGDITNFLVTLQHENVRIYRAKALEKLTGYINRLSPELQQLFLKNVFNCNLKGDFADEFFSGLSNDLIMDALENASRGRSYVPPVVLNLLGKLAKNREILPGSPPLSETDQGEELEIKTRELFRADDFEKYVPERYQSALHEILQRNDLDGSGKETLQHLKRSLQEEQLEEHVSRIIFHILGHEADENQLSGVFSHLERLIITNAETGNYPAILEACALCAEQGETFEVTLRQILQSPRMIELILNGAGRFGKEVHADLGMVISFVGPPLIDPILDRLADEKNRSIRSFYIQTLKGLGSQVAEQAAKRLKDPRWYYLRNLLMLLKEIGTPAIAPGIRPLFLHPHPKVRQEALKAGLVFNDPAAQRILLEQLEAKDATVILSAVSLARSTQDPRIFSAIAALLEKNEILDYQLEIKKEAISALIEMDSRKSLPVLQRFLNSHNLFHPIHHVQLKREVDKLVHGGYGSTSAKTKYQGGDHEL